MLTTAPVPPVVVVATAAGVDGGNGPTLTGVAVAAGWPPGGTMTAPAVFVIEVVLVTVPVARMTGVVALGVAVRAVVALVELQRDAPTMISPSSKAKTMAIINWLRGFLILLTSCPEFGHSPIRVDTGHTNPPAWCARSTSRDEKPQWTLRAAASTL